MQKVTRERHLDHMVRVVPFIVACYAVQCFVILKVAPGEFSQLSLSVLGGFIAAMVGGFVTYDLKHTVVFEDAGLTIRFLSLTRTVRYCDIRSIDVSEPGQSFSTVTLTTARGRLRIHFVDDADKLKAFLEERRAPVSRAA
jgi:hypothetical protein